MTRDASGGYARWRSWRILLGVGVVIAIGAIVIAFLGRADDPANRAAASGTLTIGDQRGGAQALLTAAGELKDVPYHIEWALFPAASPLIEALGAGAIDLGGTGGAAFAFAYASGSSIKAIYAYRLRDGGGRATAIIVRKGSPSEPSPISRARSWRP